MISIVALKKKNRFHYGSTPNRIHLKIAAAWKHKNQCNAKAGDADVKNQVLFLDEDTAQKHWAQSKNKIY